MRNTQPLAEIETERLLLCRPRLADAPALFRFLGDPDAMRFTQVRTSLRECRRHIAAHERRRAKVGSAPWIVLAKADLAILGYGGLYEDPFDPGWGLEVGYFLSPRAWGHGYATELTQASLRLAKDLNAGLVRAFAHPENLASQRVLEKSGFVFERFVTEMHRRLYRWGPPTSAES